MFALRCVGVSLSFFLLLYSVLSLLVGRGWRLVLRRADKWTARGLADFLFLLRSFPLAAAVLSTLLLVLPSFLLLEPSVVTEPVGEIPLVLGGACLLLLGAGVFRAVGAHRRTSRAVSGWLRGATIDSHCYPVPLFRIQTASPALAVAGGLSPLVLLSNKAAELLSGRELQTALRHEVAHVRQRDNLKKMLFRFCEVPGMSSLESAWAEATEMAADDAAVSNSCEALDLASALIKLSRFAPASASATLATGLALPAGSALNARIARLVQWDESRIERTRTFSWYWTPAAMGALVCIIATYSPMLIRMHEITEWLVR